MPILPVSGTDEPKVASRASSALLKTDRLQLAPTLVDGSTAIPQQFSVLAAAASMPSLLRFGRNDHGNADRSIAVYGPEMSYCHAFKKWLIWDGCRWVIDETEQARKLATLTMVEFLRRSVGSEQGDGEDTHEPGSTWKGFASASLNNGSITNMLRIAQSEIFIRPSELDVDPYLLNFQNGTVDLRTGTLFPHRRDDSSPK